MPLQKSQDFKIKAGLAQMLKGGVIMDVSNAEQARLAEKAGACAVMALEQIPSEMRACGRVCRMSDPHMIKSIMDAVSIPVMAKVRIGHFVEAQILEAMEIDYIDESEVLTNADPINHIEKSPFQVPFVCGARNLGEALRRVQEGAAMIRTKGEAGTGDISEAVRHINDINAEIKKYSTKYESAMNKEEALADIARELRVNQALVKNTLESKRLPVVNFGAGGIATPADAALLMQLGCDGVFVGSGIFNSANPLKLAKAIVDSTTHFRDAKKILEFSTDLGKLMSGVIVNQ